MSDRDVQFLTLYQRYRVEDQHNYYHARAREFGSAHIQATYVMALLLVLSSLAAAFASQSGWHRPIWSVLAVFIPALSTGLATYRGIYAFQRHAKLYRDASAALLRAAADAPNPGVGARRAATSYVTQVEGIFRTEQGQWGQLAQEIKPVDVEPPEAPAAEK